MNLLNNLMISIVEDGERSYYKKHCKQDVISYTPVQNGFYTRHFKTRFENVLCIPVELLAAFQNAIRLPFEIIQAPVKYLIVKPLHRAAPQWKKLAVWDKELAGLKTITATAAKAIGYFAGAFLTCILGFLSPHANIVVHRRFGLFSDDELKEKGRMTQAFLDNERVEQETLEAKKTAQKELEQQQALRNAQRQETLKRSAEKVSPTVLREKIKQLNDF